MWIRTPDGDAVNLDRAEGMRAEPHDDRKWRVLVDFLINPARESEFSVVVAVKDDQIACADFIASTVQRANSRVVEVAQ